MPSPHTPNVSTVEVLLYDLVMGLHSKYPLCCVLGYIHSVHFLHERPYAARERIYNIATFHGHWVPCEFHCAEIEAGRGSILSWRPVCDCDLTDGRMCRWLRRWSDSMWRRS